eukprot:Gb_13176 [translate_table: standard]
MLGSTIALSRMDWGLSIQKHPALRVNELCSDLTAAARCRCSSQIEGDLLNYRGRMGNMMLTEQKCIDLSINARTQYRKSAYGLPKCLKKSQKVRAQAVSGVDGGLPQSPAKLSELSGVPQSSNLAEFITSERVKVVAMVALALALCNADRVVMSVAIVPLSSTYGWSKSFSGVVQSSFLWGYFMSPIAGGALVDRYGGKHVMACGVAIWSMATFLTPWAASHSLGMLLAIRTLLGIAEGVALPCMNNMVSRWFPRTERARAVGLSMAGFHLGSVIGLIISPIIMAQAGVFGPFLIFGVSGFLWLLVWLTAISKNPQCHSQISKSELAYIQDGNDHSLIGGREPMAKRASRLPPFGLLLSKLPTWAIIVANAMHNWGYFIILSWMPTYFNTIYGVNLKQAAWFSAIPWAMMAALGYVAGASSDFLVQSGFTVTFVRKIMQSIGFLGPGLALLGLNAAQNPSVASAWLTAAVGLSAFSQAGFLVNLQEIAPEYGGVLHGMSNTAGTLAAIIGTVGTGFFVERMGSFQGFLALTAMLYFISTVFWDLCATGDRVF